MEFKPSALYDHVLCIIEIMKNDCYVFSSSNHQYEKSLLWCWLYCNNSIISLMFNIFFFLQGGHTIFENGGISKEQKNDLYREGKRPLRKLFLYTTQGSYKPSGICLYVHLLTTYSKLDFPIFYISLRIFNLQDLMQCSYRGRFIFGIKGPQLRFPRFIKKLFHLIF